MSLRFGNLPACLSGLVLSTALAPAGAQAQDATLGAPVENPPIALLQPLDRFENPLPEAPPGAAALPADPTSYDLLAYEFDIDFAEFHIHNPRNPPERPYDTVRLRSYFSAPRSSPLRLSSRPRSSCAPATGSA